MNEIQVELDSCARSECKESQKRRVVIGHISHFDSGKYQTDKPQLALVVFKSLLWMAISKFSNWEVSCPIAVHGHRQDVVECCKYVIWAILSVLKRMMDKSFDTPYRVGILRTVDHTRPARGVRRESWFAFTVGDLRIRLSIRCRHKELTSDC